LVEMQRPRVGHVITRLILGGAQENTLHTVVGQRADYDVTLVIGVDDGTEGTLRDRAVAANVRMLVVPTLVRPIRPLTDVLALLELVRLFRRERFEIVHTHSSKAGILGRLAAWIAGVPVVVHTQHGLPFHEYQAGWKNRFYIWFERRCAPITDLMICVSDRTTRGALDAGIGRPEQYVTIHSGFELDRFLAVRDRLTPPSAKQRLGIPSDALVVGKVARLFPLKGHEQFLAAAPEIARAHPDAWFLFVGDGPIRAQVEEKVAALGLKERTVFTGRVPPDVVPECIQAMDVVVHTSLREGLARVLPQAGAVGKPIVTFDLDGAPEIVKNGASGYLVAPLDTSALARRVSELLVDSDLRRNMGETGRQIVENMFSLERMLRRINEEYERLLAARECPRIADVPR
jgi:glycosyltransferase involved in cell wall biosynthesis